VNLALHFGLGRGALDLALDLDVGAGETLAVVGPNGAGKSSCLLAVAGLLRVARGSIAFGGAVLDGGPGGAFVPPERRGTGCLFQDHLLFPHLSVLENVSFGPRARGLGRAAARATARRWLERVGLGDRGSARPGELSGGQAQRAALARALAGGPRLLLLDEPLAAVDATARHGLRAELRAHLRDFPGPRLLVTHDAVDAFVLGDRIAVLEQGRVVQVGTPAAIGSRPRSRYVADLIGLNCFHGEVRGGAFAVDGGGRLAVASLDQGRALATVHPRAVALFVAEPVGSPRNCWRAVVQALEPAPGGVRVQLAGPLPLVAEVTAGAVEGLGLGAGSPVWVTVKATEIQVVPE